VYLFEERVELPLIHPSRFESLFGDSRGFRFEHPLRELPNVVDVFDQEYGAADHELASMNGDVGPENYGNGLPPEVCGEARLVQPREFTEVASLSALAAS
jgi:hypothetical protein